MEDLTSVIYSKKELFGLEGKCIKCGHIALVLEFGKKGCPKCKSFEVELVDHIAEETTHDNR